MQYTISPYRERSRKTVPDSGAIRLSADYFDARFAQWALTSGGRYAIKEALSLLGLQQDDVVTIFTTSGNFYISSCVTGAIESICKWSREMCDKTRAILVNHEFGYPYENVEELKKYGLPIIEDCAYDFFSDSLDRQIGKVGDYVVYSLPKAFCIEKGGILVSNRLNEPLPHFLSKDVEELMMTEVAEDIPNIEQIKTKRLDNYHYLADHLSDLGITPYFDLNPGTIPGVFMFRWREDIDYPGLKVYMQENGVESSVFYGRPAFFVPMHHNLSELDLRHICGLIRTFSESI